MPICVKCGRRFDEPDERDTSPPEALGELFLESAGEDPRALCPECREEAGFLSLLGFGE